MEGAAKRIRARATGTPAVVCAAVAWAAIALAAGRACAGEAAAAARHAVRKVTNPGTAAVQVPDGIEPGGDRWNGYAWAMETLRQPDGAHLWVGSNRNLLGLVLGIGGGIPDAVIEEAFHGTIPTAGAGPADWRGRIFRWRFDGRRPWERVYESPVLTHPTYGPVPLDGGYRGMRRFAPPRRPPALYVATFGGLAGYTRLLRFGRRFRPGDEPEEVFRAAGSQSLRAIEVHRGLLCIGTFGNEVWCSADPPVQPPPVPGSPPGSTVGWERVGGPEHFGATGGDPALSGIWQFLSWNGWLYAVVGTGVDVKNPDAGGFALLKGRPGPAPAGAAAEGGAASAWEWVPIVGAGGRYPRGLGDPANAAAGLYPFKRRVYVGTFFDVPGVAAQLADGSADYALSHWSPAQIYRFDAADNWQMVIGDPNGHFPERIGNHGAGFFDASPLQRLLLPPPLDEANLSLVPYVWWMASYNRKLYAATFDARVFLDIADAGTLAAFGVTDPGAGERLAQVKELFATFNPNPAGFDLWVSADGVKWSPVTRDGFGDPFNYGARTLLRTRRGLFVGTANPFYGAEVWRLRSRR